MEKIKFSDWQKLNLVVGRIICVENIEDAKNLYKISINLGKKFGEKTLVAGLKQYYNTEELMGRQCVVLTNLEPRKIRGIESEGMLLAVVSEDETKVNLLQPDKKVEEGDIIR